MKSITKNLLAAAALTFAATAAMGADGDSYLLKLPEAELEVSFTLKPYEILTLETIPE